MIQILFAVLAGILTIAAPCILPMLPILLGASVGQTSKQRPLLIVLGFIVSFSAAALVLSVLIQKLGLDSNLLRNIAVICLGIFGLLLIWPKPFELLSLKLSGAVNQANQMGKGGGNMSGLVLGLVLGVIWTPCAGPILASILVLIATQGSTAKSVVLLVAYSVGAGLPMLIITYGSQWLTTKVQAIAKYSVRLQQIFGVLILLLAILMYFQYDVRLEAALTQAFPQSTLESKLTQNSNPIINQPATPPAPKATTTAPQIMVMGGTPTPMQTTPLGNYGAAPEFTGIYHWLNSDPLTIAQLKGKVVLVDFWTYSCINCIRTLPYVTNWYDTYHSQGLVIIGVHTPEFAFEKVTDNVATAIERFGIKYAVAQDNDYGTWNAYQNQYWPAEYLIDQKGNIVYEHFGEGEYDHTENAIRELLNMNTAVAPQNGQDLSQVKSPEMYFEPQRLENLAPAQQPSLQPTHYLLPTTLDLNQFALDGTWQFNIDRATLTAPNGKIKLHFSSGKVYMVASADHPITVKIFVDGVAQPDVAVQMSQLYTLFDSGVYADHTLEIDIPDAGFNAFTFTFG